MVTVLAATGAASPGDGEGDAEAVAAAVGLGLGAIVCGPHATATRASAHTHAGYLEAMTLVPRRRWIIPRSVGASGGDALDGIPSLVAQILRARGLLDADMPAFLSPKLANDGPPMLDLDRAVDRIRRALAARERIVVYGDYDVDGIAGSAMVAGVVPLRDENGAIVAAGLAALNRAPLVGVRGLAERAGVKIGKVNASDIGFGLGPRLNAAGRITDAEDALRLLLTEEVDEAKALADKLEERNLERQRLTNDVVRGAREAAATYPDAWATVVADPSWAAGIVGLAASRLVRDHARPACVLPLAGGDRKGPCRSIAGG